MALTIILLLTFNYHVLVLKAYLVSMHNYFLLPLCTLFWYEYECSMAGRHEEVNISYPNFATM